MSKFHSIVSRRDFMKVLGLAGAGVGGAAAVAANFHDLDELTASADAIGKRAWWVKERELFNPTVDVDWDLMQRFDRRNNTQNAPTRKIYYGAERVDSADAKGDAAEASFIQTKTPGFSHKMVALRNAIFREEAFDMTFEGPKNGYFEEAPTPDVLGVAKWAGTPEEASKMLRAAMRVFGGAWAGFADLDSRWRNKLIISHTTKNTARIVYEDVDKGYLAKDDTKVMKEKWVIPNKQMYLIVNTSPEPIAHDKTAPSALAKANAMGNIFSHTAYASLWNFLHGLGYNMLGAWGHQTDHTNVGAAATLTGISEMSRRGLYILTPELGPYGNTQTGITDLPLAPSNPIDAGMFKFCHTCFQCANACPPQNISHDKEPSFEVPPTEGKETIFHAIGPKMFWANDAMCTTFRGESGYGACCICHGSCTFSTNKGAMVHELIRGTVSTTSLFNSFFFKMAEPFGYGRYDDPESWWDMNLPVFGVDTTITSSKALH